MPYFSKVDPNKNKYNLSVQPGTKFGHPAHIFDILIKHWFFGYFDPFSQMSQNIQDFVA